MILGPDDQNFDITLREQKPCSLLCRKNVAGSEEDFFYILQGVIKGCVKVQLETMLKSTEVGLVEKDGG